MSSSWMKSWSEFKSPLRVVIRSLLQSRQRLRQKLKRESAELVALGRRVTEQHREICRQYEQINLLRQQLHEMQNEKRDSTITLPYDPPVNGHGYGARMISLAINVAQVTGLRGAEKVLKVVFEALNIEEPVPEFTAIRGWLQRVGVAELCKELEAADDWIWIVDHSNQIGAEKVLVVEAIRASKLPPNGTPIRHQDVQVIAVIPGITWKREDVAAVYLKLAERFGAPMAILCDGAVELRESAECLKNMRPGIILLHDFKHKAANLLKALLEANERFAEFTTQLARTRSAIQQTEMSFLTPPSPKPKSRFMNLEPTLEWAANALWVLDHPEAKAHRWVTSKRLEEKLGWLRSYANDLTTWRECQQVISKGVTFVNEQGIFPGAANQLKKELIRGLKETSSKQLTRTLVCFVRDSERQLKEIERLPLSTEILESSFALYKNLERQHSKGGFTSLLAAFPALLKKATKEAVKDAFTRVRMKDVKQWVRENLGETLTSKRRITNQDFRKRTRPKRATKFALAS